MQKSQFIVVTLRPLILSPIGEDRLVTGILSGLPVKKDREYISLWNKDTQKHHITGIQGTMITKMHWLLGEGDDAEEGIVFFKPREDNQGKIDVLESRHTMRKAVNLVGVLFKKLITSADVEPDDEQLIGKPEELHQGYPDHPFTQTIANAAKETEEQIRRRIEKAPRTAKKDNLTGAVGPPAAQGRHSSLLPATTTPARTNYQRRTYTYSNEPALLTRRPNQHVKKRVAEIRKLLREKADKVPEAVAATKTNENKDNGGKNSVGAVARRVGGAAGSLCTGCGNFYECARQVEYHSCPAFVDDRKSKLHLSRYPDGM